LAHKSPLTVTLQPQFPKTSYLPLPKVRMNNAWETREKTLLFTCSKFSYSH
jgi:hypothetical protein